MSAGFITKREKEKTKRRNQPALDGLLFWPIPNILPHLFSKGSFKISDKDTGFFRVFASYGEKKSNFINQIKKSISWLFKWPLNFKKHTLQKIPYLKHKIYAECTLPPYAGLSTCNVSLIQPNRILHHAQEEPKPLSVLKRQDLERGAKTLATHGQGQVRFPLFSSCSSPISLLLPFLINPLHTHFISLWPLLPLPSIRPHLSILVSKPPPSVSLKPTTKINSIQVFPSLPSLLTHPLLQQGKKATSFQSLPVCPRPPESQGGMRKPRVRSGMCPASVICNFTPPPSRHWNQNIRAAAPLSLRVFSALKMGQNLNGSLPPRGPQVLHLQSPVTGNISFKFTTIQSRPQHPGTFSKV